VLVRDFDAAGIIGLMQQERVAHAFLAPAMILMMLQRPEAAAADYAALRTIAYGASPIAEDVRRARARSDAVSCSSTDRPIDRGRFLPLPVRARSAGQAHLVRAAVARHRDGHSRRGRPGAGGWRDR
jgi:acyl-coenzyme A synthetase/AMP-(fatty) acid ligase